MGNGMTKPEQVLGSEELLSEMRLYEINQCICDVGGEGGGNGGGAAGGGIRPEQTTYCSRSVHERVDH